MPGEFVSILMLTHNAPDYVARAIDTLRRLTRDVDYELVVVDNASQTATVKLLQAYKENAEIDTLILNQSNTLFAAGNNIAARAAQTRASHFLLLN
ncbi:MAG: glycosyltransferase, partial [Paracoccaceae bacterium]